MTQGRKGPAAGAGRRRAPLIIAAIVAAAAVVGVLVAVSASGGDDGGTARTEGTVFGVEEVRAELRGLGQDGARLGSASAAVRIEEYADLQCPFCARAASAYLPEIIERYVRPGRASLTFRTMAFIGDDSRRGALAVHAAAEQDRLWDLVRLLYLNQGDENDGWLSDELISDAAVALGIDRARLDADRGSAEAADALARDEQSAASSGIQSTPTFVVTGSGGREVLTSVESVDAIAAAIEKVRR